MELAALTAALVTLFVIIDPIALTPLFVALTHGASAPERRSIALRACLTAFGILAMFAFLGETVLHFVGISMPAFRISGGVLLFLTALDMLFDRRSKRREEQAGERPDPSVFPLALPLVAGPGSITTVILLAGQNPSLTGTVMILAVVLLVLLVVFVFFLMSGFLERLLGRTGINIATRLLGMLLAALAVQFILTGLQNFGFVS